jgi:hypothetical protein
MTKKSFIFSIEHYGTLQKFLDNDHSEKMILLDDKPNLKLIKDWILENCDCVDKDMLKPFDEFYAVQLKTGYDDIYAVRDSKDVFKIDIVPKP